MLECKDQLLDFKKMAAAEANAYHRNLSCDQSITAKHTTLSHIKESRNHRTGFTSPSFTQVFSELMVNSVFNRLLTNLA